MPINGLARLQVLSVDYTGQITSNTVHVVNESSNSPPDIAHLQGIADDYAAIVTGNYKSLHLTNGTIVFTRCTQVRDPKVSPPEALLQATHSLGAAGLRTIPTAMIPRQACALLRFSSVVASRRFRSHNFLPPAFSQASVSGDNFTGGADPYWTAIQTWVTALRQGIAGASVPWPGSTISQYNLCAYSDVAERQNQNSVALITAITPQQDVRWLRSRKRGTV